MAVAWIGFIVVGGRFRVAVASRSAVLKIADRFAAVIFFGPVCRLAFEEIC